MNKNLKQESFNTSDEQGLPELTIFDLIRLILYNKWIVIFSLVISILVSIYVTYSTTPVYLATAKVMIEKKSRAEAIFNFGNDDPNTVSNEIQIIKSRRLAEEVVRDLWDSEFRNKIHLFGTKIFYPRGQSIRRPLKRIFSFGQWSPEKEKPQQYFIDYSNEIGRKFSGKVRSNLSVNYRKGTNLIDVTFSSPEPYEAALLANTIVNVYKKLDREWIANESQQLKGFLIDQMQTKKNELMAAEISLKKFKEKYKIFGLEGNADVLLSKATETENTLFKTKADINIANKERIYIEEKLSLEEKDLAKRLTTSINSRLFALRNEINNYESELVKNASLYGDSHEAVKITSEKLNALKKNLKEQTSLLINDGLSVADPIQFRQDLIARLVALESNKQSNQAKIDEYEKLLNNYNSSITKLPEKQMEYSRLDREFRVLSETYRQMRQKYEEARIATASEPGKVRIVDSALPNINAVKPNVSQNLIIAFLFGLFAGIIIIIIREYLDSSIKSIDYINRLNIPILAIIPAIGQSYRRNNKKEKKRSATEIELDKSIVKNGTFSVGKIQRRLITQEDPKSPVSEAYRALRTSLLYSTIDEDKKTIMVSSPGPGEGKTTTMINLAITYANLGKKTLLIDGDLRRPVLHKVFNTTKDVGLTHYLTGNIKNIEDVIKLTDIENLELITCGVVPPNPSELLASSVLYDLIPELKKQYDIILFDAPPILAVTDAVVLSRLASQFIMVVRVGVTDKGGMHRSMHSMAQVNTNITGIVLNAMDFSNSYYSGNYYNYYNYYYYGNKSE